MTRNYAWIGFVAMLLLLGASSRQPVYKVKAFGASPITKQVNIDGIAEWANREGVEIVQLVNGSSFLDNKPVVFVLYKE